VAAWPRSARELVEEQQALARKRPPAWRPFEQALAPSAEATRDWSDVPVAGCFVCFSRGLSGPGSAGDPAWAGAALVHMGALVASAVVACEARAPYEPGLLALREGPVLEAAIRALPEPPEVVLVNATGRDHPRRAGLALQLGSVLELPTVGVTDRPLLAEGDLPSEERGATSPLRLAGGVAGSWLRTRRGRRPLAVHPAWRTDLETAVALVLALTGRTRAPEPLRQARRLARLARAAAC
jgi:deoxyribonuclease V